MKLFEHQVQALEQTKEMNRVAYYYDMGLGKTFIGSEKAMSFTEDTIIVVCQKSKVDDWKNHFFDNYIDKTKCDESGAWCYDLTTSTRMDMFFHSRYAKRIGVINYDLIFRRAELLNLKDFTLMLDESQLIQNETAKRTKFVLKMEPSNVVLLSGTPTSGKYERLWSQLHLLGWNISKLAYWNTYIETEWLEDGNTGFKREIVVGYKNTERLRRKLSEHGAIFMKTEEAFDLPDQQEINVMVPKTKEYVHFMKESIVTTSDGIELVGDCILTKFLYARQLCGQYNKDKLDAFKDLIDSTDERIIVFYNFYEELYAMQDAIGDRPFSVVNGTEKDLKMYESCSDSVTFVQYQSGAMGLNLQKAHITVYFTLPFGKGSCALWEQSKKRTHRIGQEQKCQYYYLLCKGTIEERNLTNLRLGKEYNDYLFERECD
jgi:SNF2 family DNA or RNA helicase